MKILLQFILYLCKCRRRCFQSRIASLKKNFGGFVFLVDGIGLTDFQRQRNNRLREIYRFC